MNNNVIVNILNKFKDDGKVFELGFKIEINNTKVILQKYKDKHMLTLMFVDDELEYVNDTSDINHMYATLMNIQDDTVRLLSFNTLTSMLNDIDIVEDEHVTSISSTYVNDTYLSVVHNNFQMTSYGVETIVDGYILRVIKIDTVNDEVLISCSLWLDGVRLSTYDSIVDIISDETIVKVTDIIFKDVYNPHVVSVLRDAIWNTLISANKF